MGRVPSTFSVAVQMRLQSVQPSSAWLCWCSINSANSSEVLVAQSCPTLCDPMACSPQTALSMAFSRQENWSGLPCPPPGDLPDPGIQPGSPALQADSLPSESPRKPQIRPGLWACFYGKAKHQQSASPLQRSACSGRHYRRGGFSLPILSSRLGVLLLWGLQVTTDFVAGPCLGLLDRLQIPAAASLRERQRGRGQPELPFTVLSLSSLHHSTWGHRGMRSSFP